MGVEQGPKFEQPETTQKPERPRVTTESLRDFMKWHGFRGEPKIEIMVDTVTAHDEKGRGVIGTERFDSVDEAVRFVKENPELIKNKDLAETTPLGAVEVKYGPEVSAWSEKLEGEEADRFDEDFKELFNRISTGR